MSLVVHVDPKDAKPTSDQLAKIHGLEVLNIVENNTKLVLLLDLEDEAEFHDSLAKIQNNPLIKSLSYAAHYSEEAIELDQFTKGIE